MKENHTEIAYILDRSGSMAPLTETAISSFNEFLQQQNDGSGEVTFTLVLFDNEYLLHADAVPIREVVELDRSTYVPRASTALLDAIGRTIDNIGQRLASMREQDRPETVVIAICTDGMENASREYTAHDIAERIKRQRETYNWEFIFLGANQDAIATAGRMNIPAYNSSSFDHSDYGMKSSARGVSRKVQAMRQSNLGVFTEDMTSLLSDMVAEEQSKLKKPGRPRNSKNPKGSKTS